MAKNTWEIGRELEYYICEKFKEMGIDVRPTSGSGNKGANGDISGSEDWIIEAKVRNTKDITIKQDVWDKLCSEVPLHSQRSPMYVLQNKEKRRWAVLDLEDFFNLYAELYNLRKNESDKSID